MAAFLTGPGKPGAAATNAAKRRDQVQESVNPVDGEGHRPTAFPENAP